MTANNDYQACRERIFALPQAAILKEVDVERWLDGMFARVAAIEGNAPAAHKGQSPTTDIMWHIDRASGVGGSESGTAYLHANKQYYMDATLPKLVDQKLFRVLPDATNHHMERGTYLEPVAQRMIHTLYDTQSDQQALDAISNFGGWPAYPWVRGNPDDVVIIGGQRFLVDYKMPEQMMVDVPLMYKAQLHHYWTVAHLSGVHIDGLLLAGVTLPGADAWVDAIKHDPEAMNDALAMGERIARANTDSAPVRTHRVDFSLDFAKDLIRLNNNAWTQNVMTGKRPRYFRRDRVELTDTEQVKGNEIAQRIARHRSLIDCATTQMDAERAALTALLDGKDLTNKKQAFPVLSVSERANVDISAVAQALVGQGAEPKSLQAASTLDASKLAEAAEAAGIDVSQFKRPGQWDKKKVQTALKDSDLEPDEFSSPTIAIGLSRSKKGPGYEQTRDIKQAAAQRVDDFVFADLSLAYAEHAHASTTDSTDTPDIDAKLTKAESEPSDSKTHELSLS